MKEDDILINYIEDKRRQCEEQYIVTSTAFLDAREGALAEAELRYVDHLFYGGYDDAERRVIVFIPEYYEGRSTENYKNYYKNDDEDPYGSLDKSIDGVYQGSEAGKGYKRESGKRIDFNVDNNIITDSTSILAEEDDPLAVLRVKIPKGSRKLTHRDYLGSILALGIDRNVTGDILVRDDGADIIILKSMAEFLLSNYTAAGRTTLATEIVPIGELELGAIKTSIKRDTLASMRLDNAVSSVFPMSRGKAQEFIQSGLVFVNNVQCTKPDKTIETGDKIVLRGKGRAIVLSCGSLTKKGRIPVEFEVFV